MKTKRWPNKPKLRIWRGLIRQNKAPHYLRQPSAHTAVQIYSLLMHVTLVLMLTACAQQPLTQWLPLPPPPMPALSEPLPSVSYSQSVATDISTWAKRLTDMSTTSKP